MSEAKTFFEDDNETKKLFEQHYEVSDEYDFVNSVEGYIHRDDKTYPFFNSHFKAFVRGVISKSEVIEQMEIREGSLIGESLKYKIALKEAVDLLCYVRGQTDCKWTKDAIEEFMKSLEDYEL